MMATKTDNEFLAPTFADWQDRPRRSARRQTQFDIAATIARERWRLRELHQNLHLPPEAWAIMRKALRLPSGMAV